jgi:hypothetical protein
VGEAVHQCEAATGPCDRDRYAVAGGADDGRGLFEQLRGLLDSWEMFDLGEQVFVESFWAARVELEVCRPGDGVNYADGRAGEAARRDGYGEHEGHGHGHAKPGEQLLYAVNP